MTIASNYTYQEIISQPIAWAQALEMSKSIKDEINQLGAAHPNIRLQFTGCGSTYYLSLIAASLFQEITGHGARAFPASELVFYPNTLYEVDTPTMLVAISRSGTTSETIAAVRQFREKEQGPVVAITNYGDSPLSDLADLTLAIPAGQEKSVAQTRSFSSMFVTVLSLAAQFSRRSDLLDAMEKLPGLGEKVIHACLPQAKSVGENLELDRFYFLGSGPRYGLACEANLKMKEMTLTHSEPFHFLEFRHGPMSMVTGTAMVIGLLSDNNRAQEQAVLDEMRLLGGQILSLGESDADISLDSSLPVQIRDVLYLPPLQLMAYYRSMAKGLNPDQPHNLKAVVKLDLESI